MLTVGQRLDDCVQCGSIRGLAVFRDLLRTVWIVEVENLSLREAVGATVAEGMQGIAFQLGRTAIGGRGDEWNRAIAGGHGGGVKEELAGNGVFHASGEWNEIGLWATATSQTHACQSDRGAHELHEITLGEASILIDVSSTRKLRLEVFQKFGVVFTLAETAPNARVGFWSRVVQIFLHR